MLYQVTHIFVFSSALWICMTICMKSVRYDTRIIETLQTNHYHRDIANKSLSSRHCKQIIIIETLQTNHLPILNVWQSTCSWATWVRFVNSWAGTFYLSVFFKIKTTYLGGQATRQGIYVHTYIYIHICTFNVFIFFKYQNHTSRGPGNKTGKMYTHIHTYTNVISIDSFFLNLKTILLGGQATRQEINIHNTYIYTPIYFLSIYFFLK